LTILRTKPAAIFDIDGTLVDTRETHLRVWEEVLAEAGIVLEREALERLFGKHSDEWVRELLPPERPRQECLGSICFSPPGAAGAPVSPRGAELTTESRPSLPLPQSSLFKGEEEPPSPSESFAVTPST